MINQPEIDPMNRFLLCCFLAALSLAVARPASACSCVPPPPPRDALAEAHAVFSGFVVETRRDAEDINTGNLFVTLTVERVWKGEVTYRTLVVTPPNSAMCGFPFEKGARYLVYAGLDDDGALRTHLCTRTVALENATEDLAALGEGMAVEPEDRGGLCGGPSNIAAMQAFVIVMLVVSLGTVRRAASAMSPPAPPEA